MAEESSGVVTPGPANLITDVAGLAVGQAHDPAVRTGVTVVVGHDRLVCAADIRGGAPGTRETDALDPTCLVEAVDAVVLSGGSVFGLAAADGAVSWLAEHGRGFAYAGLAVPVVPAAILFDLANGGEKGWGDASPYHRLGRAACAALGRSVELGNAGAGYGARAGTLKGGLGSASAVDPELGVTVGALVAVNSFGEVVMDDGRTFWAWPLEQDGEFGNLPPPVHRCALQAPMPMPAEPGTNTTLAIVATDADLTRSEARRVAVMAQDGLARAMRPAHTPFDGDSVFALATAARPLAEPRPRAVARIGSMAADTLARAVARGVYHARTLGDITCWRDRVGPG